MERLTILGTGAAMVTKCYNTCFTLSDETGESILVDGGGGNGILRQLELAQIKIAQIRAAFITHIHTDHVLGLIWVVRYICQEINKDRYEGNFCIYGHQRSLDTIRTICMLVLKGKLTVHFDSRILFVPVADGHRCEILGRKFLFFDICSRKELQHGFIATLKNGRRLAFLGDEPMHEENFETIRGADIVVQEAYCAHADAEVFNPYAKHHGTALLACQNAQRIGAKMTVLVHTEGRTLDTRRQRYTAEGRTAFDGEIFVPDDLEIIDLDR
ncbi:MAG: MBL fold metallo-hydrolase [Bacteroidales bacterium]|nr:MBL fold metallo-hydrolase [Bacteroidales bacterium]